MNQWPVLHDEHEVQNETGIVVPCRTPDFKYRVPEQSASESIQRLTEVPTGWNRWKRSRRCGTVPSVGQISAVCSSGKDRLLRAIQIGRIGTG